MEVTDICRQYRRRIAFCEVLCLFRRLIQRALCSNRKVQKFGRLYVKISQSGWKLRSFFENIVEGLRFARFWAFFEAYDGVHDVLTVICSNLGAYTSKYLNRDGS
jgi:3-deoxy-D-arabino-heptulosonate 7-phosphate (DAHP) synthase class II